MAGLPALEMIGKQSTTLSQTAAALGVPVDQAAPAVDRILEEWKEQRRELEKARAATAGTEVSDLVARSEDVGGVKVVVHRVRGSMADLLPLSKQLAGVPDLVAILGAEGEGAASVVVTRGPAGRVDSAAVLRAALEVVGGKGGGRPEFAQGAGPKVEALDAALAAAKREVLTLLSASG